ncbi:MAG: hypothetical protein K6T34_04975 [Thermoflavifilum sp.]|nr:hypothetical protein [Thermoflavifilum sp.]
MGLWLSMLLWCTAVHAQDTAGVILPDTLTPMKDTISTMNIEHIRIQTTDSLLQSLYQQIKKLSESDRQNAMAIQGLLQGREIDNMTKYQLMKNNIINAVQTYYLLNKKIIDLKSRTSTNNLDVFITSINNPESKELGFSFNERVIELVKKIVLQGKADANKRNQKIVESTNSIINSPIFKSFTALSPPLGIANAIMTFFHSISITDKSINEKNLKTFEDELNKYVMFYTSLNEGNQKFKYGLNFNRDQLTSLHEDLYNHLLFTASALKFNLPDRKNKTLADALNQFFLSFTRERVEQFFKQLEQQYTNPKTGKVDYERLLRENGNLKEVNNQLEDLVLMTKRFENIYNEYFTLLDTYYAQVNNALQIAADNGLADKNLVKQKQQEFAQLKQEAVDDIKASININELKNTTDNIKYRFKIY